MPFAIFTAANGRVVAINPECVEVIYEGREKVTTIGMIGSDETYEVIGPVAEAINIVELALED